VTEAIAERHIDNVNWLDRLTSRRVAGWAFVLWPVAAISVVFLGVASGSTMTIELGFIVAPVFATPRDLYLARRLAPRGNPWITRLAVLNVAAIWCVSVTHFAAITLTGMPVWDPWPRSATALIGLAFAVLVARFGRSDPALPWLRLLVLAAAIETVDIVAKAMGTPSIAAATRGTGAYWIVGIAYLFWIVFVPVWSFVVGRRLLGEERRGVMTPVA
jgi:hypothetical protein